MRIEEIRGPKCNFRKSAKIGRRLQPHVAAVSGDGTAEGGSGEVVSGARKLGGQALAADWSRIGRNLPINRRGFGRSLGRKLFAFEGESKGNIRGLLF